MRPSKPILGTLLITSAMGLALAACNRTTPAQQPLSGADLALPATAAATSPGPVYDRYGPPPKRIPVGRVSNPRDDWAWAERSYALDNAFYDTAPDYGFYDDGYEPWVWQTSDRWAMYGDPYDYGYDWDDDGYYYYYQPGAVRPYFIRDAYYGYGFDDVGRLVVIYDLLGRIMPQSFLYEREPYVSRYYQRAYLVRQASLRVQPVVITQAVWQERAPIIQRYQSRWIEAARTQPQWVDYRQRTGDRFVRAFDRDRQQRQQRTFAANGQPQQTGGLLTGLLSRNRQAQPAQVAQNDQNRRGFLSPGERDRQAQQALPQQALARADRGRDRLLQAQAQPQPQASPDRRGFFTGRDRRADQAPQRQAEAQARQDNGRQRREMERQQQVQQRQAEPQVPFDNGRQRQEMVRQQQAQQRQAEAQGRQQQQAQQRQAEVQARQQQQAQQRQAEVQARQQQQAQQRQAEAQARQQQQAQQRQAEVQARQQQQAQQRQAEVQARQQQHAQQRQAEVQARQQQQAQQRQAEVQARQQQQAQQRQAEAQARQQQQAQQGQAEAQARQQQHAQQRQAEVQARQQQQAQQRQAEVQARQQQQAQQRQAEAQARQQQQQRAQQPQRGQEADAQPQQNGGHGHGKKG